MILEFIPKLIKIISFFVIIFYLFSLISMDDTQSYENIHKEIQTTVAVVVVCAIILLVL